MRLPIPKDIILNFSAMIFLGVSLFLTWEGGHWTSFLSWRGVFFIVGGILFSGLVIGWPLTRLHRRYSMSLIQKDEENLSESSIKAIRFTGTILMLVQILIVYYATAYVFPRWALGH